MSGVYTQTAEVTIPGGFPFEVGDWIEVTAGGEKQLAKIKQICDPLDRRKANTVQVTWEVQAKQDADGDLVVPDDVDFPGLIRRMQRDAARQACAETAEQIAGW